MVSDMSAPRISLNVRVPWDGVCGALGIPFPGMALPLRTTCPLCGKHALDLLNDTISGGQWHHCVNCGTSGDMIELAAAAWQCEPGTALAKLAEAGVQLTADCDDPALVAAYVERYPGYRKRMTDLWEKAKANYPLSRSRDIGKIRAKHNLKLDVSLDRWRRGPGHLVGCVDRLSIELAFNPQSYSPEAGVTSRGRVFKGGKWGEVLTVPYYDLPDRIRAFMFIGREGRPHTDQVFRRATLTKCDTGEAGLAGIHSIELAGDPTSVIAVDDYLLSLQIQMRHFRSSMKAIPMVVWHDDGVCRTRNAWTMLGGKRVVFWARELTHKLVLQAVETDGRISTAGPATPDRAAMMHYLRIRPGNDLERIVLAHAKPWTEMLREWMETASDGKISDMTLQLEQAGADVSYIYRQIGGCHKATRIAPRRSVQIDNYQVVEERDRWFATTRGVNRSEISNATFRLTHAIKDRETGNVFYRGVIRFKGAEIPFIEKLDTVRLKTVEWLQAKLIEAGAGVLVVGKFKRQLHRIAVLFHEPEFVTDDLYKWVERLRTGQEEPASAGEGAS